MTLVKRLRRAILSRLRLGVFTRSFLLIAFLMLVSLGAWLQIVFNIEEGPRAMQLAQRIATRMGARLPSPRMVDAIYQAAPNRLAPQPESERHAASIERHNQRVQRQMGERGFDPQRLTAGHQKDIILSRSVTIPQGRVGIYGWHQPNGQPIQPFSTVHDAHYLDYSHGVRLISPSFSIDGQPATEWPQGFAP